MIFIVGETGDSYESASRGFGDGEFALNFIVIKRFSLIGLFFVRKMLPKMIEIHTFMKRINIGIVRYLSDRRIEEIRKSNIFLLLYLLNKIQSKSSSMTQIF